MINVETDDRYVFDENGDFRLELSADKDISGSIEVYSTSAIKSIVAASGFEEADRINEEKHRKNKRSNAVIGAVVGGLIDASDGEDSIINGVLIGAGIGFLLTGSKSDPTAHVVVQFNDGSTLPLEVDREDFTILCAKATEKHDEAALRSIVSRPLTYNEANDVLSSRNTRKWFSDLSLLLLIPIFWFIPQFLDGMMASEPVNGPGLAVMESGRSVLDFIARFAPIPIVFIVGFKIVFLNHNRKDLLRDDEGKAYEELESASS